MQTKQTEGKDLGNLLYDKYVKPLEKKFWGKYVVVTPKGKTFVGDHLAELTLKAVKEYGRGNYAFKIGDRVVGEWL